MDELDFVSWKIVQWVLWAGSFGVAAFLTAIAAAAFYAGYSMRPKPNKPLQPTQALRDHFARQDKPDMPMGNVKMDHIKYDILPDGTLGPGDPRGLEGPE
jgi:hypothetical protein